MDFSDVYWYCCWSFTFRLRYYLWKGTCYAILPCCSIHSSTSLSLMASIMVSVFLQLEHKVLTAFIFTIDFFVMLLNVRSLCLIVELLDIFTFIAYTCLKVYCLLCMVSQYQEMKNGRGLRKDSFAAVMMTCNLCSKQKI